MPAPDYEWLDADDLADYLGQTVATADAPHVARVRLAVANFVEDARKDVDYAGDIPPRVLLGAFMFCSRLIDRRNSPSGVQTFTDGAVEIGRVDPDVERMLRVGRYAQPKVG